MKHEKLSQALSQISDSHITEAAGHKKRRYLPWISSLAAVLAVALLALGIFTPLRSGGDGGSNQAPVAAETPDQSISQTAADEQAMDVPAEQVTEADMGIRPLAVPSYPKLAPFQNFFDEGYQEWNTDQQNQYDQPYGYADSAMPFFRESLAVLLDQDGTENTVCSPLNVYMALTMLAEATGGESRQQILELLGSHSISDLRTQASYVWNAHYHNDCLSTAIFANSLWLDDTYRYDSETVDMLANNYYASVYQGDLGSEEINDTLRAWLNQQTRGLLQEQTESIQLDSKSVLSLASTVYYSAKWTNSYGFSEKATAPAVFHSPSQELEVPFMNRSVEHLYYWGDTFGAVGLGLEDGSVMWLILPDEGSGTGDVLRSEDWMAFLFDDNYANYKEMTIHLSLPKFDVTAQADILETLQTLGITDVADPAAADFSALLPDPSGAYVGKIDHAARVTVDEEGILAAAFTVIPAPTERPPMELEEIQFTLDRPFLFVIKSQDGLPMFAGVVNQP